MRTVFPDTFYPVRISFYLSVHIFRIITFNERQLQTNFFKFIFENLQLFSLFIMGGFKGDFRVIYRYIINT